MTGQMTLIKNMNNKNIYIEQLENFKKQIQEVQDELLNILNEVPDRDIRKDNYKDFDFMMFFDYNTEQLEDNFCYDKEEEVENNNKNFFLKMVYNFEKYL